MFCSLPSSDASTSQMTCRKTKDERSMNRKQKATAEADSSQENWQRQTETNSKHDERLQMMSHSAHNL